MDYQFRGVSVFTGEMVIGELRTHDGIKYIHQEKIKHSEQVKPETIGLASTRKDRKGKTVFCGDITRRFKKGGAPYKGLKLVEYKGDHWVNVYAAESEIIGNIHQNPNLLAPKV